VKMVIRVVALACLAGVAALAVGAGQVHAKTAGNSVTYLDSTGEDPASLDVSQVVVSNDDGGLLTFAITLKNGPAALTGHNDVEVYLDTDNNASDGAGADYAGAEMVIQATDGTVKAFKWDGKDFTWSGAQPTSLIWSYSGGVLTIHVKAADLSLTSFGFWVLTDTDYTDQNSHVDFAPDVDHGTFAYTVKISPPVTTTKPTPKKTTPKCRKGQRSTKAHPCHK
jgi:hypothetical protein